MNADEQPGMLRVDPSGGDSQLDEGRKYWKAAIAHLPPEKREAAWEFYLDRLESSAAADTLGGVMLLLEAHLAFFDDLPARLGAAAQRMESALKPLGEANHAAGASSSRSVPGNGNGAMGSPRRKFPTLVAVGIAAALGGIVTGVSLLAYQHHRPTGSMDQAAALQAILLARTSLLAVEPWSGPVAHRDNGCVILIANTAWTESTQTGGTKVYVRSPVEEVRRNLEALRQLAHQPASNKP